MTWLIRVKKRNNYIDKLIREIATEMAVKELGWMKFILGFVAGTIFGLVFWIVIILELYTLAPFK